MQAYLQTGTLACIMLIGGIAPDKMRLKKKAIMAITVCNQNVSKLDLASLLGNERCLVL